MINKNKFIKTLKGRGLAMFSLMLHKPRIPLQISLSLSKKKKKKKKKEKKEKEKEQDFYLIFEKKILNKIAVTFVYTVNKAQNKLYVN